MSQLPVPANSLSTYLTEINKFPLLSVAEERDLAIRYHDSGDVESAHKLVTANLRFVVKVAYEYAGYGVRMADLIQEGNVGLMQAVKKFDPRKGYRLLSYAVWWIRAYIQNFILKTWSLVKLGTTQAQRKLFYKLGQAKGRLANYLGEVNHLNEEACGTLAKILHVKEDEIIEMEARMKARDASLDQPLSDENPTTRLDLIAASDNQEEELVKAEERSLVKASVQKALTRLNDRERFIVEKRLMSDQPMTLQEIGDLYQVSRERARQLEAGVKKKIRLVLAELEVPLPHASSRETVN